MTLWFDVTDIRGWHLPYLTGIQRTAVTVLAELLAIREDVRIFAYNCEAGILQEVDGASLPPVVRNHFYAGKGPRRLPNAEVEAIVQLIEAPDPHPHAPPSPCQPQLARRPRLLRSRLWLRQQALRLLRRCKDDATRDALTDLLRSSKSLALALYRRRAYRETGQLLPLVEAPVPAPAALPPALAAPRPSLVCPLFTPGDVCLSLSATWGMPNYAEAIAFNKQGGLVKCINLIYDLIPTLFPQWMPPGMSQMVTRWARKQITNADLVLTISEFQRSEICRYIASDGLPVPPVEAIRLGDDPPLLQGGAPALPRYIPSRKFALCVSTVDVRKNHHCLYHVWRQLSRALGCDAPQLVLVGVSHLFVADLMYRIRHDREVNRLIVHLPSVTDEELAWYYRKCLFTIYPSMYEGWGLPVSESLSIGKYCIAADAASIPEVGGNLVDYFDPMDYPACYRLAHRAATDPDYVRRREEQIRANYKPSTWRMTAEQISTMVDSLARKL